MATVRPATPESSAGRGYNAAYWVDIARPARYCCHAAHEITMAERAMLPLRAVGAAHKRRALPVSRVRGSRRDPPGSRPQQPVENARRERLELAVDGIRKKYGGGAISYGEAADHLTRGEEA